MRSKVSCKLLLDTLTIVTLSVFSTYVQAAEVSDESAQTSVSSFGELLNPATKTANTGKVAIVPHGKIVPTAFSEAIKRSGVSVKQESLTLSDLTKRGGPAILHLSKPEQFVTMAAAGSQYVSFYNQGTVTVVNKNALSGRYNGESFVLASPDDSAPQLHFDDPVPVENVLSGGGEVARQVKMTNFGNKPISVAVDSTSCGCTVARLSSQLLAPGQTGTLEIKMKVGAWGRKTERVTLRTSDPQWPRPVIAFQVQVPTTVTPNPSQLNVETPNGQSEERTVFIVMPSSASVVKVTTTHPFVQATLEDIQSIDGGHAQRAKVKVTSDAPLGEFSDNVTFELKGAEVPRVVVPLKGVIRSDVTANPQQLFLGQLAEGKTIHKTFILESSSGRSFSIQDVKSQSPSITIKPATGITATSHAVEVVITAPTQPNTLIDSSIKLTLSDGQKLSVPVFAMVVQPKASDATTTALAVGAPAPDFSVLDMAENPVRLSNFRNKRNLLLTFFPKCFTGGCAGQLASLQEERLKIAATGTDIVAVSTDGARDQAAFATKLGLLFPLIPDTERKLSLLYGAVDQPTDLAQRMTVLIDKQGIVRFIDTNINVQTHGADMIVEMRDLGMIK